MSVADYKPFVERMIERYEGGYGWSAGDPGGPTKFGITCYDLADHRHEKMTSMAAWAPLVRAMPLAEAENIYAVKYATACDFNGLVAGADCVVFDFGVNSGPSRAIKYAQQIVGVDRDGILGPLTQEAINAQDPQQFVIDLCNLRMSFLRMLDTWRLFGKGWTARVNDLQTYATALTMPSLVSLMEPEETFSDKTVRVPLAFAKAYHAEDTANA